MRRVMLMVAAMAVMVSLFAAAAYAAQIKGTGEMDFLTESQRSDTIKALSSNDYICAGPRSNANSCEKGYNKNQTPGGLGDRDRVHGNAGEDFIDLRDNDGKDIAWGGRGIDDCWGDGPEAGDAGDEFFGCERINGFLV